ncbi:IS3 family transposase [Streptomyces sp. NPDC002580]|uniref:IS3 family transposase n=1 Tax=Streptomyces sp. NPDC002580 TaxID=3364653 RepID=UPI0036C3D12F
MAAEGHTVRSTATLLRVSESGYYAWRRRAPSVRPQHHVWLTELILSVHRSSGGAYGSRRIHHELRQFYGVGVSRGTVERLMRQAGVRGRTGRSRWAAPQASGNRTPQRRRAADAGEHPPPAGAPYCAVAGIDRRRPMGPGVEQAAAHELVLRALDTALAREAAQSSRAGSRHVRWAVYAVTENVQALAPSPQSALAADQYAQASADRFRRRAEPRLPPRQHGNDPGDLPEEPKRLPGTFASHACRFDEPCACGVNDRKGTAFRPKAPLPETPEVSRLAHHEREHAEHRNDSLPAHRTGPQR